MSNINVHIGLSDGHNASSDVHLGLSDGQNDELDSHNGVRVRHCLAALGQTVPLQSLPSTRTASLRDSEAVALLPLLEWLIEQSHPAE